MPISSRISPINLLQKSPTIQGHTTQVTINSTPVPISPYTPTLLQHAIRQQVMGRTGAPDAWNIKSRVLQRNLEAQFKQLSPIYSPSSSIDTMISKILTNAEKKPDFYDTILSSPQISPDSPIITAKSPTSPQHSSETSSLSTNEDAVNISDPSSNSTNSSSQTTQHDKNEEKEHIGKVRPHRNRKKPERSMGMKIFESFYLYNRK